MLKTSSECSGSWLTAHLRRVLVEHSKPPVDVLQTLCTHIMRVSAREPCPRPFCNRVAFLATTLTPIRNLPTDCLSPPHCICRARVNGTCLSAR